KEQVFGTIINDCLHFMFQHDPLFPTLDQVLEHYYENFPSDGWQESEAEIYKKQGETMLKKFYAHNQPWNFVVLDLESRFEVTLEDAQGGTTHILAGIMDRIDKLPDGRIEIIDYKTQKRIPPQDTVDKDLQLSIYAMGLKKRWPHIEAGNIKLSLQFLKHDEKLTTTRSEDDFKRTEAEVLRMIKDIESRVAAGRGFEPRVSPLCDFCGYKPLCPAWKHLYKNVKNETIDGAKISGVIKEYFSLREEKQKAEVRLKELGVLLTRYLAQEEIDRVFDEVGVISKRLLEKYSYDFEKIRSILEPLGKWQDILKADEARLKNIMKEIPEWAREEIKKSRSLVHSSITLAATKKKIKLPEASG
ncbi:MAG: PD-(D/E)XK nuclease family protein, partial [Candidatus Sungbacteria bacterium]|nr:PD-(D/E)XK nuclease family protein [Candidatus Sungbacteria bacterium]